MRLSENENLSVESFVLLVGVVFGVPMGVGAMFLVLFYGFPLIQIHFTWQQALGIATFIQFLLLPHNLRGLKERLR